MRAFYEDLWARLPERPGRGGQVEFERRAGFLGAHLRPGLRVLDLGCGDGWAAEEAPGDVAWTGAEIAEAALARAHIRSHPPGASWVRVEEDAALPFPDAAFDLVWCSETLEHVADTARFLAQARRVLRPGGELLVTVPNHSGLRRARALVAFERAFPPLGDHLRFYTARSLRDALEDAGFARLDVRRSGPLLLATAWR